MYNQTTVAVIDRWQKASYYCKLGLSQQTAAVMPPPANGLLHHAAQSSKRINRRPQHPHTSSACSAVSLLLTTAQGCTWLVRLKSPQILLTFWMLHFRNSLGLMRLPILS
jgi:hypothetical protein